MSATAKRILDSFSKLPPLEKREVAAAILRQLPANDNLTDQDLTALADDLFLRLDRDEADHVQS